MKARFSLKDHLFNIDSVTYLADLFLVADLSFNKNKFVREVMDNLMNLELKARIAFIAEILAKHLSDDKSKAMNQIVEMLPQSLDPSKTDNDFGSFIFAPLGEYIVRYCCDIKHLKQSLFTLREITMRFSMEDAMRTFLNKFPAETLAEYDKWVLDENYHVRRLVSESLRPSLPWSQKISLDYKVPLKYLDILYGDKTRYVVRSVANHLNDVAKKDPALVVSKLNEWKKQNRQQTNEFSWLLNHSLRTLVKRGDSQALMLLGYNTNHSACVTNMTVTPSVKKGQILSFDFDIISESSQNLVIDFVIGFVKKNGAKTQKVFKLKKLRLPKQELVHISKKYHLKADATTFTLYAGVHDLSIQVNGVRVAYANFEVF